VSFVGWLVLAYVLWAVVRAVRNQAGAAGSRPGPTPGVPGREEALRQTLEALGRLQGRPAPQVDPLRARPDKLAVRPAGRAPALSPRGAPAEAAQDYDDQAEKIIRQRRREVAARNQALAGENDAAFEAEAYHDAAAKVSSSPHASADAVRRLRDLVAWQEILGPPVALRDDR